MPTLPRLGHTFFDLDAQEHLPRLTSAAGVAFGNCEHHIKPLNHAAKDAVLAVEPRRRDTGDEELRAIRVWASVGHREHAR